MAFYRVQSGLPDDPEGIPDGEQVRIVVTDNNQDITMWFTRHQKPRFVVWRKQGGTVIEIGGVVATRRKRSQAFLTFYDGYQTYVLEATLT